MPEFRRDHGTPHPSPERGVARHATWGALAGQRAPRGAALPGPRGPACRRSSSASLLSDRRPSLTHLRPGSGRSRAPQAKLCTCPGHRGGPRGAAVTTATPAKAARRGEGRPRPKALTRCWSLRRCTTRDVQSPMGTRSGDVRYRRSRHSAALCFTLSMVSLQDRRPRPLSGTARAPWPLSAPAPTQQHVATQQHGQGPVATQPSSGRRGHAPLAYSSQSVSRFAARGLTTQEGAVQPPAAGRERGHHGRRAFSSATGHRALSAAPPWDRWTRRPGGPRPRGLQQHPAST